MAENAPFLAPDLSKLKLRFWLQLLKASKHLENQLRDRLRREFATTLPRFDVMAMLEKSGSGLKMSQLSSELMVSNGNVTGIIDRLVADGLVMRVSIKGDRRATLVRLTTRGEAEFRTMAKAHEIWVSELLAELDENAIEKTMTTLAKVRDVTQ